MYYISEPGPRCSGSNTFTRNSWRTSDAGWVDLKQLWLWAGNIWYFLPMKLMKRSENPQRIFWLLFSVCLHIGSQWGRKSLKRAKKKGNTTPSPKKIGRCVNSVLKTSRDRCGSSHRWTGDSITTGYEGDILVSTRFREGSVISENSWSLLFLQEETAHKSHHTFIKTVKIPSLFYSLLYNMLIYRTEVFPASTGTTAHTTRHK